MRPDRNTLRFVRALLAGGEARLREREFVLAGAEGTGRLPDRVAVALAGEGVLDVAGELCRAGDGARSWVRRNLLETDHFAAQHRQTVRTAEGVTINLAESPLGRLARPGRGESEAFLDRAQIEAGERIRHLAERARLQPRLTMSYPATHTVSGKAGAGAGDISDLAADARRQLNAIVAVLPRDCAGVVMDVCALAKGLQTVETERGWPRRSAKLVLRIGLDQVARHLGLSAKATGPMRGRQRTWLGEGARPKMFGEGR